MQIHDLKTWPEFFDKIMDGTKKFELRKNDRDFNVDDVLRLMEYDPDTHEYTGREHLVKVTYILKSGFSLPEGVCIMSIKHFS